MGMMGANIADVVDGMKARNDLVCSGFHVYLSMAPLASAWGAFIMDL